MGQFEGLQSLWTFCKNHNLWLKVKVTPINFSSFYSNFIFANKFGGYSRTWDKIRHGWVLYADSVLCAQILTFGRGHKGFIKVFESATLFL